MADRAFRERSRRERRAAVLEMGGPFFAARGPGLGPPWFTGHGKSGGTPTSMKIESPGTAGRFDVTVTTMTDEPMAEDMIIWRLLGSDIPNPPAFPATSTVHKGKLAVRIAGRRRPVTTYLCGPAWLARTGTSGRRLWIDGYRTDPRTIEIVRLTDDEIKAALDLTSAVIDWMSDQSGPNPLRATP